MSKELVKRFNVVCGNSPSQGSLYDVWKQLKQQAALVKEEGLEVDEGAQLEDMENLIKEWADVWYVNTYLGQLLEAFGVDTKGVKGVVCANNAQKYTTSYTYAKESQEALEEKGTECYIETTAYEGETYYTVRRNEDQKVMKLKHHERPDLSVFVPQEFK